MYMATYEPTFMKSFRTQDANRQAAEALSSFVTKRRKTHPSHGTVFGISDKPVNVLPMHTSRPKDYNNTKKLAKALKPTEFHIYAKAGPIKKKS